MATMLSAISASGSFLSPTLAHTPSEPLLLTRTAPLILLIMASIWAFGGTGVGIFPRGPRYWPRTLPILGIRAVSAKKKSYSLARPFASFLFPA